MNRRSFLRSALTTSACLPIVALGAGQALTTEDDDARFDRLAKTGSIKRQSFILRSSHHIPEGTKLEMCCIELSPGASLTGNKCILDVCQIRHYLPENLPSIVLWPNNNEVTRCHIIGPYN